MIQAMNKKKKEKKKAPYEITWYETSVGRNIYIQIKRYFLLYSDATTFRNKTFRVRKVLSLFNLRPE